MTDIAINPANSNEVFVTFAGYNFDTAEGVTDSERAAFSKLPVRMTAAKA